MRLTLFIISLFLSVFTLTYYLSIYEGGSILETKLKLYYAQNIFLKSGQNCQMMIGIF